MKQFDWSRIQRDKDRHRAGVAARSFEEKLRDLERLRERTGSLRGWSVAGRRRVGPTANLRVVVLEHGKHPAASGTVHLHAFGMNPVLTSAATPEAHSSVRAVTSTPRNPGSSVR